jgi:uncharacterized membrane protein
MDKQRLEVFSDALIAIIMTILVLDLKVPALENATEADLTNILIRELPHFYGFLISFSLIAMLWFNHHDLFKSMASVTRTFARLNFLFVGAIALVPFSTSFAAEYPDKGIAVSTLALNLFLMNIFLAALFLYAIGHNLTTFHQQVPRRTKIKRTMGMIGTLMFLFATFVAFLSTPAAIIMMTVVPIMHAIPIDER